jgi:hypothetical protein
VGFANDSYDPVLDGETWWNSAWIGLGTATAFVLSGMSDDGLDHRQYDSLRRLLPAAPSYEVGLRFDPDGNVPQVQFNAVDRSVPSSSSNGSGGGGSAPAALPSPVQSVQPWHDWIPVRDGQPRVGFRDGLTVLPFVLLYHKTETVDLPMPTVDGAAAAASSPSSSSSSSLRIQPPMGSAAAGAGQTTKANKHCVSNFRIETVLEQQQQQQQSVVSPLLESFRPSPLSQHHLPQGQHSLSSSQAGPSPPQPLSPSSRRYSPRSASKSSSREFVDDSHVMRMTPRGTEQHCHSGAAR